MKIVLAAFIHLVAFAAAGDAPFGKKGGISLSSDEEVCGPLLTDPAYKTWFDLTFDRSPNCFYLDDTVITGRDGFPARGGGPSLGPPRGAHRHIEAGQCCRIEDNAFMLTTKRGHVEVLRLNIGIQESEARIPLQFSNPPGNTVVL